MSKFDPHDHLSFAQWKKRNTDLISMMETCPDCHGRGETTCPCCDNQIECETCSGDKQIIILGNGAKLSLETIYYWQLRRDQSIAENFLEGKRVIVPTIPYAIRTLLFPQ